MNDDDLIARSILIITEYYQNNLEPYFESISDDVLWLGPANGQIIQGKQNIIDTWMAEEHNLTFTMGDIKAQSILPSSSVSEVTLHYEICTHFPSGSSDLHNQRLHFTWRKQRIKDADGTRWHAEIVMINISNLWHYDSHDTIYPVHYESMYMPIRLAKTPQRFVTVRAIDRTVYRLLVDNILYIETVKRTSRILVHTKKEPITINGSLPGFEKEHPGLFVRIHASYLVNPLAVREIRRFTVTLSDGTELPIPEKKYTQVKKMLMGEEKQDKE